MFRIVWILCYKHFSFTKTIKWFVIYYSRKAWGLQAKLMTGAPLGWRACGYLLGQLSSEEPRLQSHWQGFQGSEHHAPCLLFQAQLSEMLSTKVTYCMLHPHGATCNYLAGVPAHISGLLHFCLLCLHHPLPSLWSSTLLLFLGNASSCFFFYGGKIHTT